MAAFEHAAALGVDVLELDLGLTRDDVLVVAHDPEVNRKLCVGAEKLPHRLIRDLSFAELQAVDCGARRNPRFPRQQSVPGQRIPRLEQVLDLLGRHPHLGANVEIKTSAEAWPAARFVRVLVPLLLERNLARRVTVQSFDADALRLVRRARLRTPGLQLSALVERRAEYEPMLRSTSPQILSPRHTTLRRGDVSRLHARGLRVIPWTVNDPQRMQELIRRGVDGIITDRPDLLLHLLCR